MRTAAVAPAVARKGWHMLAEQELLIRILDRLASIEDKVERITAQPRAVRIKDLPKFLPYRPTKIRELIARGIIRTVDIDGQRVVAMTEIVRLTSLGSQPPDTSPRVRGRVRSAGAAKSESDAIRTLAKRGR